MAKKPSLLERAKLQQRAARATWLDLMPADQRQEMLDVVEAYLREELKGWSGRYLHEWLSEQLSGFKVSPSTFTEFLKARRRASGGKAQ